MKQRRLLSYVTCLLLSTASYISAQRVVTGQVLDEQDFEVIGATVVTSDGRGTITDLDGNFSIEVSDKEKTLTFSYMGCETQKVNIKDKRFVRVMLKNDAVSLQEVVAVGYGTQKKVNLTGSIENVNMKNMEGRPLTNAGLALQGQVSGVMVVQESGQAGADGAQIRIRGISSMENNNSPLVIIDGMEGDINDVDPKDIETMTVMKDASSAAIYGNKAASGVVLITTKRGKGEMFQVDYSFMQSFQEPTRLPDVIDGMQYVTLFNEAEANDGKLIGGKLPTYNIDRWEEGFATGEKQSVNWHDIYFKIAPMQKHHFNLMLSSGNLTTSTSFSYLNQEGMLYGTGYNKFSYRTNIGAMTKNKKIKLDINISGYRDNIEDNVHNSAQVLNLVNRALPQSVYVNDNFDKNNPSTFIKEEAPEGTLYNSYASYIGYKENGGGTIRQKNRISNNYVLTYEPIKGLSFDARYNFFYYAYDFSTFVPVVTLKSDLTADGGGAVSSARASLQEYRSKTFYQNLQFLGRWEKTFKKAHKFNILVGGATTDQNNNTINTQVSGFVTNVPVLDFGENPHNPYGYLSTRRTLSFFGRANYNYKERYLFEANLRADGSSRFLKGNRWGVFPSFSAAWRVSQEEFFKPASKVVSNLKIRASYGKLGNENIYTNYAGHSQLKSDITYSFEGKDFNAMRLYEFADRNTTWETTEQVNFGVDMSLFSKLNLTFDTYYKRTYDILARVKVTNIIGAETTPYQNIGEMVNKGWELSASYNDAYFDKQLRFGVTANISGQRNRLTKLNNTSQDYVFNTVSSWMFSGYNMIITKVGESYGSYYGYEVERIFQVDDFTWQDNSDPNITHSNREYVLKPEHPTQAENPRPGDLKFKNLTEDGIIDDNDRTIIGKQLPDLMYSLNLSLGYKGIDVSCFFQGVFGGDVYTGGYLVSPFFDSAPTLTNYWENRWTFDNPSTEYQRVYVDKTKQKIISDYYLNDASYLRLKNVEIGYTFPKKWMDQIKVKKLKIHASVQNPFLWSKVKSFDPEKLGNVVSSDFHPQARIYSIGANIVF